MEHLTEECSCTGRQCTKCQAVLCIGSFSRKHSNKDGIRRQCQRCCSDYEKDRTKRVKRKRNSKDNSLKPERDTLAMFLSKVNKADETGCWLWLGALTSNGYGTFYVKRVPSYAHRWSYTFYNGVIPPGAVIDHLCGVRHCVNPMHLEAVDQSINVRRSKASTKAFCKYGHPYNAENTYLRQNGNRQCRECSRLKGRARTVHIPRPIKTHCPQGHPYNGENTKFYRGVKYCGICKRNSGARTRRRKADNELHQRAPKTHCNHGHPYNEENSYIDARGIRICRICRRECWGRHTAKISSPRESQGYTKREWGELKAFYNYTCLCCGRQEPDIELTADHVIPRCLGGGNAITNIQPLCGSCNSKKHKKIIDFRPQKP